MDLGIPGGCCSGQTMVGERGKKEQGWTWGFLEGVVVDRPWWGKEGRRNRDVLGDSWRVL